ncbi:hypothetical protein BP6252_05357 [Coleophoma cylindrospora]|uniref:Uncharacterized protein n=1 Tax=Coleophoma cylindrospora TaxID=1849047 RepID=A0A3D8RTX9_9HELO|nr:hypothetical protein BP6252_05357 [Coleophoma cylindrospora]
MVPLCVLAILAVAGNAMASSSRGESQSAELYSSIYSDLVARMSRRSPNTTTDVTESVETTATVGSSSEDFTHQTKSSLDSIFSLTRADTVVPVLFSPTPAAQTLQSVPISSGSESSAWLAITPPSVNVVPGGGATVTISEIPIVVSLAPSGSEAVTDGTTTTLDQSQTTLIPAFIVNSTTFTQNSASQFIAGSVTLTSGEAVTITESTGLATVSLEPSGSAVVIGGIPSLPPAPTSGSILFGNSIVSQDSQSNFVIGSQTLSPGSAITVSGQTVSLSPFGSAVIINGFSLPSQSPTPPPVVISYGSLAITANSQSGFVIGSQTLFPGSAITVNGQVLALPGPSSPPRGVIVFGSSTITENSASNFVIGSQTLTPGGVITAGSETVSLSPAGTAVEINGLTSFLQPIPSTSPTTFSSTQSPSPSPVLSLQIGSQTLTLGASITIGGDILSLAPSGTSVVIVGSVTSAISAATKKSAAEKGVQNCPWFMLVVIFSVLAALFEAF